MQTDFPGTVFLETRDLGTQTDERYSNKCKVEHTHTERSGDGTKRRA